MVEDSAAAVVLGTERHAEQMQPIAESAGAAFQVGYLAAGGKHLNVNRRQSLYHPAAAVKLATERRAEQVPIAESAGAALQVGH